MTYHYHNHDHPLVSLLQLPYSTHNQANLSHKNEAGEAYEWEYENE